MIALTDQESVWVDELAGRLRLIQADAAGAPPAQRREFLQDEMARSFKNVPPPNRKRYLEALVARFPVAGQKLSAPVPVAAVPAPPPAETVEQLLERLIQAVASLTPKQRAQFAQRLSEAGLRGPAEPQPAFELSPQVCRALGLAPEQRPAVDRLVQLGTVLAEAFQRMDQAALGTMRELAPKSSLLKRPQDFRTAVAQFLSGQAESVEPPVRAACGLMGALLAAMLGGSKDFGRKFVNRLSPSSIEEVVIGEGGGSAIPGFGKSKKEKCWDKYVLLAKEMETPDLVDKHIRDCQATFVEKKVLSGANPPV